MAPTAERLRSAGLFGTLVLAWGFNYLFVRAGLGFSPPLWLAFGRAALGAIGIGAWLLARPVEHGVLDRKGRRDALLLGVPNTALFFGLWFSAAATVLPGEAAVIVYTFPLWVALLAQPVLGHRMSPLGLAAIGLGFGGVVLITEPWSAGGVAPPIPAVAELLAGAFAWAAGTVLFQRRFRGAQMQEANFYQLLGGSAGLLIGSVVLEPAVPSPSPGLFAVLLWLGFAGTALAYGIWFSLLSRRRAATLSAYLFLVPVVALAASVVLLGERLDLLQGLGVLAVLVSVFGTGRESAPLDEPAG